MKQRHTLIGIACLISSSFVFNPAGAQLGACDQLNLESTDIPGGCIAKTLAEQIGSGHGDITTPGSATYLIKRDPARAIRRGRQLFQRKFSYDEGLGPRVNDASTGDITMTRALGAGLADSCAACHGRPKGSAGFGGDVATRPDSRDAPHLFGLGLVEQLADEMTQTLRAQVTAASSKARATGREVVRNLSANGVRFGRITAAADGSIDRSEIEGVDDDLRVRPFFHHGGTASIREFVIGAFNDEMGLQAWDPVLCAVTDPQSPQAMTSPAGFDFDPDADVFSRPPVCDEIEDADADGRSAEIDPALIDHMEFYLLNYFKPGQYQITGQVRNGRRLMQQTGCNRCHVPTMTIQSDRRIADVETSYDPDAGIFNQLFAVARTLIVSVEDGDPNPLVLPSEGEFVVRNFYSDLKRHDLGPAFHERDYDGNVITEFVTEPLWGVGSTAPYGHDGRSINLDAVIRRHGGDAASSTRRYERLSTGDQQDLLAFLQSLVLFPPDDTASNLNPGDPLDEESIQDPATHGSINLGELFQISEEGPE